ncbi:checkpoint clamp complex protein Rad1 [Microbotryomycetes sp. JL201]|nr:checkpoint clamp complex protein Rad1 [Microbotryomycetes sp. JL201]
MPPRPPPDLLVANVSDVRPLSSMLRALSFKQSSRDGPSPASLGLDVPSSDKALMEIRKHGIKMTVEEGRSLQGRERRDDRNEPDNDDEDDEELYAGFGISLTTMLECFNIFGNAGSSGLTKEWTSSTSFEDRSHDGQGGSRFGGRYTRSRGDGSSYQTEKKDDGKVTSLRMTYAGEGEPLVLLLEEGGIVTRCEITTYEPDPIMDVAFDDERRVQKLIMKSEWLRDAFGELEPTSQKVVFHFSPPDKHAPAAYNRYRGQNQHRTGQDGNADNTDGGRSIFRLESVGTLGSTEMDYPNDRDVLETYECLQNVSNSYKYSHLMHTKQALMSSIKTSIRTQDDGLMSFQFMIPLAHKRQDLQNNVGFVEFCVALDDEY